MCLCMLVIGDLDLSLPVQLDLVFDGKVGECALPRERYQFVVIGAGGQFLEKRREEQGGSGNWNQARAQQA